MRIRSLAQMARALGRSEPLFALLEIAAEEARRALGASSCSVSRLEEGSTTVRTLINVGDLGPCEQRWPQDETYQTSSYANLGLVLSDLRTWTITIEDSAASEAEMDLLRELQKGSSLGSPIIVDGQLWGEFFATRHVGDPGFDNDDVAYVEALVAILSGSISRSLREESLERLAYQDPLTGLWNRRALEERTKNAFTIGPGKSRAVSVVQVDINRLKEVNDTFGHNAGDQLIQSVARGLVAEFNHLPGSLVARVGGDEFTVLVVGHEPSAVATIADRLCQRTWRFGDRSGISCAAVSAVLTSESRLTPAELFMAADEAQYVVKRRAPDRLHDPGLAVG
jgi:diguanylate cyclase (GGDEF)-like protein